MCSDSNLFSHKLARRGFTLIELLVVISIIGLLSSVVISSVNVARAKGRDAARESNLHNLVTALALYAVDHDGVYPTSTSNGSGWYKWNWDCVSGTTASSVQVTPASSMIPGLVPNYIPSFPEDPSTNSVSCVDTLAYFSNGTDYKIMDYNIQDSPNPGGPKSLIDPTRNYNKPYSVTTASSPCYSVYSNIFGNGTGGDTNSVWAVWSSPTAMCW